MSKYARDKRIVERGFKGGLSRRRFNKSRAKAIKRLKSDEAHIIWAGTDWYYAGGRGLIHKGRKPR